MGAVSYGTYERMSRLLKSAIKDQWYVAWTSNYVLQLISRNFGRASCKVGWEFGNYKHEIMLIGNRPIKFGSFEIQIIEIRNEILMKFVMKTYCINY